MKVRPMEAEICSADGRTDGQIHMTKVTFTFRNCANAPVRVSLILAKWVKQSSV